MDACCLVNLYSAGDLRQFIPSMGLTWHIPIVVVDETLFVRGVDSAGQSTREPIDLQPVIDAGLVRVCEVGGGTETALYVQFAGQVDDGEAMCLAIAKHRGWLIATDDRKALRLAESEGVDTITTPELIKKWCDAVGPSDKELGAVLRQIESRASFVPRVGSVLYAWWAQHAY